MTPTTKSAVCVGAIATGLIALAPYLQDYFLLAYIIGAFAAVWFTVRRQHQSVSLQEGAILGFRSGFYGFLGASAIYDIVWKILHYELWRVRNLDRVVILTAESLRDAFTPSIWFLVTLQIIIAAIGAGAFGAPSGLLAAKLLSRRAF